MSGYLPVFIFLLMACVFVILLYLVGAFVSPFKPTAAKVMPYECGFPSMGSVRRPFDARYYLIAILFIVFDIETALLFPWAVSLRRLSWVAVASMLVFLFILGVVYAYEWLSGALEWESSIEVEEAPHE